MLRELSIVVSNEVEIGLETFDACRGMDEDDVNLLASLVSRQKRGAGDVIIREGGSCRSLFFLAQGQVSVQSEANDRIARLACYRAGVIAVTPGFKQVRVESSDGRQYLVAAKHGARTGRAFERDNASSAL